MTSSVRFYDYWDHDRLRPHSFYARLKWSCFDLLCMKFLWSTFHFFVGDLKFYKVAIRLKFVRLRLSVCKGDSRWVVNALALWNTAEARKLFLFRAWKRALHLSNVVYTRSNNCMFCLPARFLYQGATIVSVFNCKMKDEKRKNVFSRWLKRSQEKIKFRGFWEEKCTVTTYEQNALQMRLF